MIDIENDVFNAVATAVRDKYKATMYGEYIDAPKAFPTITIFQIDNSIVERMRTSERMENAVSVTYEANVYTNAVGTKKGDAKKIMADIDTVMTKLGFARKMLSPTANLADATIYRLTARYSGTVDRDLWIYQTI